LRKIKKKIGPLSLIQEKSVGMEFERYLNGKGKYSLAVNFHQLIQE